MEFDLLESLDMREETLRIFQDVLIVLGIGLLMGLEREYSTSGRDNEKEEIFAGVRTFPLVALVGYLAIYLGDRLSFWVYALAFAMVFVFVIIAYYFSSKKGDVGGTSDFALIITFLLSSLVFFGEYLVAAFLALMTTTLLALKVDIHRTVRGLSRRDILSILMFLLITAFILPLLPDQDLGLYGVFNPFRIWLIVSVFISINFTAYFLHKFISTRYSLLATGILGGFASSTATAWYFSRQGGRSAEGSVVHTAAIVLASSIMFPRLLIWLLILNPQLFSVIWLPIVLLGLLGFLIGLYLSRKTVSENAVGDMEIANPINLRDAGVFALLYVLILLLVGFAEQNLGQLGILFAAGISGLTDVDAITISMANYANEAVQLRVAAIAVLIGALANTLVKYLLCLIFGKRPMRRYASLAFVPIFLLGIGYIIYLLLSS
jgi:uncharacterized membrane protein (DUF4010 family)